MLVVRLSRDFPGEVTGVSARDRAPRFVQNDRGEVVEVILSLEDYKAFLHVLAIYADWETLPPYLQDAIDRLLIEEAKAEALPPRPLRELLSETGETP